MKLEDVTEKIIRIIKKVESCGWSDRSGACSKDCPLWNSTEPGECCDSLKYLKNEKIKEFSERITNIFREEYLEEMKEQSDDVVVSGDKKETTIEDVVDYLEEMVEKFITLCRKTHCNECRLKDKESNKMCSFLTKLESITVEGKLEEASKVLKFESFKKYPDPNDTVTSFIQNKVNAAESESEKSEYQKILKRLQEE